MKDRNRITQLKGWDAQRIQQFRQDLLAWYDENKRDLPWRKTRNPYAIWVSEIMLQQTQVATVIPYYERFIEVLPTIEALATADETTLLNLWQGLGYYSRVRNMQIAAQQIVSQYGGKMPRTMPELLALKGIGPYTAAAIGSMAFDLVEPALDGNLFRIIARLFEIDEDIVLPKTRKTFMAILYQLIDPERPGDFNQAMMDLGATVMTPSNLMPSPHPLAQYDLSYQHGTSANYPVKVKKVKATHHELVGYVVLNHKGEWLMRQHQRDELLAGLWHFPLIEQQMVYESMTHDEIVLPLLEWLDLDAMDLDFQVLHTNLPEVKHIFTHRVWRVSLVMVQIHSELTLKDTMQWVAPQAVGALPLSTLQQKLMKQILLESEAVE